MKQSEIQQRRKFIKMASASAMAISLTPAFVSAATTSMENAPNKIPALPNDLVKEFVRAAHGEDLDKVEKMLDKEKGLVNATWDWGGGDWETALGGAAHMGQRDMARLLLSKGARIDAFCAAMLGDRDSIKFLVKRSPHIVNVPGPHGIPLLYHVALSGDVKMANIVKPNIKTLAKSCNRSLHAVAKEGHAHMAQWLLKNGANDPNYELFGRTPMQIAQKAGHKEVIEVLKKHGAS